MEVQQQIAQILDEVLSLKGRSATFSATTPLLGAVPELDSMAVVAVISELEERLGIEVADDEIDGQVFETFGALCAFAEGKLAT
jgi:acyl carrier protein